VSRSEENYTTPLVTCNLTQIQRLKRKIQSHNDFLGLLGGVPEPEDLVELADTLKTLLPEGLRDEPIRQSCLALAGVSLTKESLNSFAWRIAANVGRLRQGKPVAPWQCQTADEWVPMVIQRFEPWRNKKNELGGVFNLQILAGTPCEQKVRKFFSDRFCRWVSQKIGFTPTWKKFPFKKSDELVGLRLYGLVLAEKSRERPFFEQIAAPASIIKFNRDLISKRARVGYECPAGFKHACYQCPIGYDSCECGTHPVTYQTIKCRMCHKSSVVEPHEAQLQICIFCKHRENTKRRKI